VRKSWQAALALAVLPWMAEVDAAFLVGIARFSAQAAIQPKSSVT
jgi:hypothetical protein